jgi:hypothetical protein
MASALTSTLKLVLVDGLACLGAWALVAATHAG